MLFLMVWIILGLYVLAGLAFALTLHLRGLSTLDAGTQGASILFRILITPGLVALWPVMLRKWQSIRRSASGAGRVEAPFTPRTLRGAHGLIAVLLALLLPVLLGAALVLRPAQETVRELRNAPQDTETAPSGAQP